MARASDAARVVYCEPLHANKFWFALPVALSESADEQPLLRAVYGH
jgi:hypothetical protein